MTLYTSLSQEDIEQDLSADKLTKNKQHEKKQKQFVDAPTGIGECSFASRSQFVNAIPVMLFQTQKKLQRTKGKKCFL